MYTNNKPQSGCGAARQHRHTAASPQYTINCLACCCAPHGIHLRNKLFSAPSSHDPDASGCICPPGTCEPKCTESTTGQGTAARTHKSVVVYMCQRWCHLIAPVRLTIQSYRSLTCTTKAAVCDRSPPLPVVSMKEDASVTKQRPAVIGGTSAPEDHAAKSRSMTLPCTQAAAHSVQQQAQ